MIKYVITFSVYHLLRNLPVYCIAMFYMSMNDLEIGIVKPNVGMASRPFPVLSCTPFLMSIIVTCFSYLLINSSYRGEPERAVSPIKCSQLNERLNRTEGLNPFSYLFFLIHCLFGAGGPLFKSFSTVLFLL